MGRETIPAKMNRLLTPGWCLIRDMDILKEGKRWRIYHRYNGRPYFDGPTIGNVLAQFEKHLKSPASRWDPR